MNHVKPMIWNINASLFQSEQQVKQLKRKIVTFRELLAREQKANKRLECILLNIEKKLREYAEALPGDPTTPDANGTQ